MIYKHGTVAMTQELMDKLVGDLVIIHGVDQVTPVHRVMARIIHAIQNGGPNPLYLDLIHRKDGRTR